MAKSYIGQTPQSVSLVNALTERAAGQSVNGVTFGKVVSYCISDFNRDGYSDVKITYDNNVEVILVNTKNALWGAESAAKSLNAAQEAGRTDEGAAFVVKKYNTLDGEVEDYNNKRANGTALNFDSGAEASATNKCYELVVGRDMQSEIYALLQAKPAVTIPEGQTYAVADGKLTGDQLIDIRNALSDKAFADVAYTATPSRPNPATVQYQATPSPALEDARAKIGNPFGQGAAKPNPGTSQPDVYAHTRPVEYEAPRAAVQERAAVPPPAVTVPSIQPATVRVGTLTDPATFRAYTFGKAMTQTVDGAEVAHVTLSGGRGGTMMVVTVDNIDTKIADLSEIAAKQPSAIPVEDIASAKRQLARLQDIKPLLSNPANFYATLSETKADFSGGVKRASITATTRVAIFSPD